MTEKTIITCAATGASLTPSMSPYLPISPEEISTQSVAASKAGAAIIHLHARNPDGTPTNDTEVWREIVSGIRDNCDSLINMSASLGKTSKERLSAVVELRPDLATVIVGSMNYGLFRKAENQGVSEFESEWEKEAFGPSSYEIVTDNNFAKIGEMLDILIAEDIAIEFECYDVGHLYILDYHLSKKNVKRPIIVQFLTGILGGIASHPQHLVHMKTTAEQLFGSELKLFIHGTGMANIRTATAGGLLGTHIRIGQEDNLFDKPGVPFESNAAQVERMRLIFDALNIEVANATEAREILQLS
ncbi:3-keto-5-aminohexanoate cleavage protein [Hoeflea sp. WL0058]|uniref:3-keto-5-aminohexanoate cleavage protein n=1 Tax=Flavimaribacter sediminis TaxID=2865987 RepID=A0AAE2ZKT7_9HYPH|nr:3-keto-5-aminohexanoate cleavage protein [Flavimaribacter sediminis]MBW8636340.1 3-keto-5-aminohexanoate cleavage protein [Flavimaribacter sediminis]